MARSMKKRNPAAAAKEQPFPHFLPDGTFLAFVAEAPEVRATAKTRAEAERAVLAAWRRQTRLNPSEEAEIAEIIEKRKDAPTIPWRDWMKKYA